MESDTAVVDIGAYEYRPILDFGDAPVPYPTTLDAGARHIAIGPQLGDERDGENNGQPSSAADGDDNNDGDDEDGVMFGTIKVNATMAGVNVDLQNADTACVDAWLDFDGNGVWDEADQILDDAIVFTGL